MALGKGLSPDEIILKIKAEKSDAEKSVKSIKQELREAQQEALALGRKFGENSTEANQAAKKVAKLRDEVDDFKKKVEALNPDKFARFSTATNGIVRGFQAAQGAAALFGNDSKDLEKTLAKLQATMAFADGIQGVLDTAQAFSGLGTVIKTKVVAAFATLRGAILATGLGALVVAIGYVINEMMNYNDELDKNADKEKNAREEREKSVAQMEKQVETTKKLRAAQQGGLDELNREIDLLKAKGATEQEIHDKKLEILAKELSELRIARASGLDVEKAIKDKENEIEVEKTNFKREQLEKQKETQKKHNDKIKEENAKTQAALLANEQRRTSFIKDQYQRELAEFDISRAELRKKAKKSGEDMALFDLETQNKRSAIILSQFNKELDAQIANNQKKLSETKAYYEADGELTLAELQIINDKQRQLLDEQFANNKISLEAYNAGILVIQKSQADKEKEIRDKEKAEKEKAISEEQSRLTTHYELLKLQAGNNMTAMLNILRDETAQNQLLLEKQLNDRLISEEQYQLKKLQLNAELENAEKAHRQALNDIAVNTAQNTFSSLIALNAQFSGKSLEAQKRAFKRNKALQIADSVINTYSSAVAAFAQGTKSGGPYLGAAYAAIAIAAGLANIAKIKAQKFEGDKGETGSTDTGAGGMAITSRAAQTGFATVGAPRNIQTTPQQPEEPKPIKVYVVQKEIAESTKSADSILAKAIVK